MRSGYKISALRAPWVGAYGNDDGTFTLRIRSGDAVVDVILPVSEVPDLRETLAWTMRDLNHVVT